MKSVSPIARRSPSIVVAIAAAVAIAVLSAGIAGCGPSAGLTVDPIDPVSAPVGVELELALRGTSPDGSPVTFDFDAPDLPDLKKRKLRATITTYAGGQAVFRWLPLAADVGRHVIEFRATGSGTTVTIPVLVTVVPGADAPPVFREPVGEGTVLDMRRETCAEVPLLVEDNEQPRVDLALGPPKIPNAVLTPTGDHNATFRFCPSRDQLAQSTIYVFTFVATAGTMTTTKTYTIVVLAPEARCSSAPPVVTVKQHGDTISTGNLHIFATITDDIAVTTARVFWSITPPADPMHPDLAAFATVPMVRRGGDAKNGAWEGLVPNPIVNQPPGTTVTFYYVVEAQDADPPEGCAHVVRSPDPGVLSFKLKRP